MANGSPSASSSTTQRRNRFRAQRRGALLVALFVFCASPGRGQLASSFPADQPLVSKDPPSTYTPPPIEQLDLSPQQQFAAVIQQLQQGTVFPQWYGPQFSRYLMQQTGGTGYSEALAKIGPVRRLELVQQQPLPKGTVYGVIAFHEGGLSRWSLAISSEDYTVVNGVFDVHPAGETPPHAPQTPTYPVPSQPVARPEPPQQAPVAQVPAAPAAPAPAAAPPPPAACIKFPNLC